MLRRVDVISENFILFVTSKDLIQQKNYLQSEHIICVNNISNDMIEKFFSDNGYEFNNYKNLVYDARKKIL